MIIEDTIHIEAPPDVVWAVTEAVERWPEWTPTMTSVARLGDGPFRLGSAARIKQPGQPATTWTVTAFTPGTRFTWETSRPGLRMQATHEMAADGAGTTNRLQVELQGLLAVLLAPVLRRAVRRALARENAGLKAHCEKLMAAKNRH